MNFRLKVLYPKVFNIKRAGFDEIERGVRLKRRYEERLQLGRVGRIVRECWMEKRQYGWRDKFGEEKEKYLNRIFK